MQQVQIKGRELVSQEGIEPMVWMLRLSAPAMAREARPGQFIMLRVGEAADEPLLARPFSVHGVEGDDLLLLYQVVGRGTRLLSRLELGAVLGAWGPLGRGFDLSPARPLLVAGGMGIAPLSFAATAFYAMRRPVHTLVGVRSAAGLMPLIASLESWTALPGMRLGFASEDGSMGYGGLVTELVPAALAEADGVLACGPLAMLKAVAALAEAAGKPCQVSLEAPMACGVGACLGCAQPDAAGGYFRVCREGPVAPASRVDWDRVE